MITIGGAPYNSEIKPTYGDVVLYNMEVPPYYAKIHAWYTATSFVGVSNDSPVSYWSCSAPQEDIGRHLTSSITPIDFRPMFKTNQISGRPALYFSSSKLLNSNLLNGVSEAEIFAVLRTQYYVPSIPADRNGIWCLSPATAAAHYPYADNIIYESFGSTDRKTLGTSPINTTNWAVYNVAAGAGKYSASINNSAFYVATINTVSFSGNPEKRIGISGGNFGDKYFVGYFAEIVIYNQFLTPTERSEINQFLMGKYGIS